MTGSTIHGSLTSTSSRSSSQSTSVGDISISLCDLEEDVKTDVPFLGMLIDRTSFDETDDYGVDKLAIEPVLKRALTMTAAAHGGPLPSDSEEQHKIKQQQLQLLEVLASQPSPAIGIMKDGKVRRRLRWRPKIPKNKKTHQVSNPNSFTSKNHHQRNSKAHRQAVVSAALGATATPSSNCSVMSGSNSSQTSKQSKRSLHSFASTETAARSNLRKDCARRFPLPHHNYPINCDHSSITNVSPDDSVRNTIGNEGGLVHARIVMTNRSQQHKEMLSPSRLSSNDDKGYVSNSDASCINGCADEVDDEELFGIELVSPDVDNNSCMEIHDDDYDDGNTCDTEDVLSRKSLMPVDEGSSSLPPFGASKSKSGGGLGLPPLFKLKSFSSRNRSNRSSSVGPKETTNPPPCDSSVVSGLSLGSFLQAKNFTSNFATREHDSITPSVPRLIPIVSTDEESDRFEANDSAGHQDANYNQNESENSPTPLDPTESDCSNQFIEDILPPVTYTHSLDDETSANLFEPFASVPSSEGYRNAFDLITPAVNTDLIGPAMRGVFSRDKSITLNSNQEVDCEMGAEENRDTVFPEQPQFYEDKIRRMVTGRSSIWSAKKTCNDGTLKDCASLSSDMSKEFRSLAGPDDSDDLAFFEAEKNLHAIDEMAIEHLKQGEYTEALEVFEEILRGQLTRYGEYHYRVGTALHNIGLVHIRQGDYSKAIMVYKEAVRIRKQALQPFHPDISASLAQLGVAYLEAGKQQRAIGSFREALKIRRKTLGNYHPKVAKILNNIGCALFDLNELDVARLAFEEARDIQRNLLRQATLLAASKAVHGSTFKDDCKDVSSNATDGSTSGSIVSNASLLSIASTQRNIASIKLYCGEYDEAIIDFEEALLIQRFLLGDDHPLTRRTEDSLAWLENKRTIELQQQHGNIFGTIMLRELDSSNQGSSGLQVSDPGVKVRIESVSVSDSTPVFETNKKFPSTEDENIASRYLWGGASIYKPKYFFSQCVFDTIERGIKKLSDDWDYMSCGATSTSSGQSGSDCGKSNVHTHTEHQHNSSEVAVEAIMSEHCTTASNGFEQTQVPVDRRSSF